MHPGKETSSIYVGFTPHELVSYAEPQPLLERRIQNFYRSLGQDSFEDRTGAKLPGCRYKEDSIELIKYSTTLARTHNANECKKRRKRKFDNYPYMDHSLQMAEEAVRMRLHPTIVAACLIHDVAEDVKFKNLRTPEAWMDFFERAYEGYEDKDRLMRILRAELKTETLSSQFPGEEERNRVIDLYTSTPTGQAALGYLDSLREGRDGHERGHYSDNDKQKIAEVLFDLNNIFSQSYAPNTKGVMVFDPSILIVKILDTWQNLKTPGFWGKQLSDANKEAATVAKLIRARILTNVAEFFGMRRVSSDMTQALSAVQDIDHVDVPGLSRLLQGLNNSDFINDRIEELSSVKEEAQTYVSRDLMRMLNTPNTRPNTVEAVFQMPYGDPNEGSPNNKPVTGKPYNNLAFIVADDPNKPRHFVNLQNGYMHTDGKELTVENGFMRAEFQTMLGRRTREILLYDELRCNGDYYRVRFESTLPRIISSAKAREHGPSRILNSPEYALFGHNNCRFTTGRNENYLLKTNTGRVIDTRQIYMIDFLLSPHKYVANEHQIDTRPYVIIVRRRVKNKFASQVYFATNKTNATVYEIALAAGVTKPVVRALGAQNSQNVLPNDHHVLDSMKEKGEIGNYNVVVIEEAAI